VDDGGIFCNSKDEIKQLLKFLSLHLVVKDLGEMENLFDAKLKTTKEMILFTFTSQNCYYILNKNL
jgi:hypothetical protein